MKPKMIKIHLRFMFSEENFTTPGNYRNTAEHYWETDYL